VESVEVGVVGGVADDEEVARREAGEEAGGADASGEATIMAGR